MALSISGFESVMDYTIVRQTAASTTADVNVAQGAGSLLSAKIDNSSGTAICYLKLFDGDGAVPGTSVPQMVLRCPSAASQVYEMPEGMEFTNLNLWVTRNPAPTDTTVPAVSGGTVLITLTIK